MPGTGSVDFSQATALRNFIETYRDDLVMQAFSSSEFADFAIGIDGVKGKQYLPKLYVGDLSRRWAKQFAPPEDVLQFGQDMIEVDGAKIELELYPQDFEGNHIVGRKRKKGQGMDVPYQTQMMNQVFAKLDSEIGNAFWNATKKTPAAASDKLHQLFKGIRGIFTDKKNAGTIEFLGVPNSVYDVDNVIPHFRDMRLVMGGAYRKEDNYYLTSPEVGAIYYDAIVKKAPNRTPEVKYINGIRHIRTFDNTAWIAEINDLSGTEFVAFMSKQRMYYAVDAFSDTAAFNTHDIIRGVQFYMDYKFGVQLVTPEPWAVVYNGK